MPKLLSPEAEAQYERDGYYFPVRVLSAEEAQRSGVDGLTNQ